MTRARRCSSSPATTGTAGSRSAERCDLTLEGAAEHIHKLSRKYRGRDYNLKPEEQRVIVRVTPERVTAYGFDS